MRSNPGDVAGQMCVVGLLQFVRRSVRFGRACAREANLSGARSNSAIAPDSVGAGIQLQTVNSTKESFVCVAGVSFGLLRSTLHEKAEKLSATGHLL